MNVIKRLYCRAFQLVLRAALPVLPYRNPEILYQTEEVPRVLGGKGLRRPLIVTDRTIRGLGLTEPLEERLTAEGFAVTVYDETGRNPTTEMVESALSLYRENRCDCLIAFGGGGPMDCAKAAGACVARPNKDLKKMAGILRVRRRTPTLVAIPTTAGTGSETTLAAVIVDGKTRHKYVVNDFPLIPDCAVLDPALIHSLPPDVAAATGMDALTHAVEAYIGGSTTAGTRADAERAVKLVFENIRSAAAHESRDAERNMLLAAHLAGRAFTRSYVGYVHAVSHSLSGMYNLPHGETNAVLLPMVLELYGPVVYKKLSQLAVAAGLGTEAEPVEALAKRFIESVYRLNQQLGIPASIQGIREEDIPTLAAYADREANPLYPVPVLWGPEELATVYRKAGNLNGQTDAAGIPAKVLRVRRHPAA